MRTMNKRKFTVECEIPERWVDHFCTMLREMESLGALGMSRVVAIYADGDGDFRPTFDIKTDFNVVKPENKFGIERLFDAG